MSALFVFEGPDGVGKTVLSKAVAAELQSRGLECRRFSFPGDELGTLGRHVYALHHSPSTYGVGRMSATSLQILHVAAHIDAIENAILPALQSGAIVLLDRFWWSTLAYGEAAGVPTGQLRAMVGMEQAAWSSVRPTLVLLLERDGVDLSTPLMSTYRQVAATESQGHSVLSLSNNQSLAIMTKSVSDLLLDQIEPATGKPSACDVPHRLVSSESTESPGRAPFAFSRLSPAKESVVYDTYWRFAAERQAIFFARLGGGWGQLTKDPILQQHKFTNAYRASDRVSQFLIRNVIYKGSQEPAEVFFRTILFKLFNKIETWQLLERVLDSVTFREFDLERYDNVLAAALAQGQRIYSGAYIMPPARGFGSDGRKHPTHLALLKHMMEGDLSQRLLDARSMSDAFELLRSFPMIGDFLGYQFVTDLNYSGHLSFSEMEFVVPGPGARDGIRKCFQSLGGLSDADIIRVVTERQELEFERLGIEFRDLWGRRLQLIDCQNLFCEVDKYSRVAHPDVAGISGRTRIKQTYKPKGSVIAYWYPPKWGINEAALAEQGGEWRGTGRTNEDH